MTFRVSRLLLLICWASACGDDAPSPPDAQMDGATDGATDAPRDAAIDGDASLPSQRVTQWSVVELDFTASETILWWGFPLRVTFSHPESGTELVVDGFYDGAERWLVRFAPTRPGVWRWVAESVDAGLRGEGDLLAIAPSPEEVSANRNLRGHLEIVDQRYFAFADGTPAFLLGDTNWAMNRITPDDPRPLGTLGGGFESWADDRERKGFTLVLIRYLSQGNEAGEPFTGYADRSTLFQREMNAAFFQGLDQRIDYLWRAGFVIGGHPDWITEVNMTLADATDISRYLLARYGAYNLIWSLTGEFHLEGPTGTYWSADDWANMRALGRAVATHNAYGHPLSVHPAGWDPGAPDPDIQSSLHFFGAESWLDHHWIQTYIFDEKIPFRLREAYDATPPKPVIMAEPCYEGWDGGCLDDAPRRQAFVSLLSGAAAHVYGADGVWNGREPAALGFSGSDDMTRVADFFRSISFWRLQPDVDCVTIDGAAPDLLTRSDPRCAADPGSTYVLYLPSGNDGAAFRAQNLLEGTYQARWYDPRTGAYQAIGSAVPDAAGRWPLPARPSVEDWVCILQME